MKLRKFGFAALAVLILAFALSACSQPEPAPPVAEKVTVTLVADRSCGAPNGDELELIDRLEVEIDGPVTVEALAQELTTLTKLQFKVNSATVDGDKVIVDWAPDAALLSIDATDDLDLEEDPYFFFDAYSLNFFVMDSLLATIYANMDITEVYYTMDGGQPLVFAAMEDMESGGYFEHGPENPYMGSPFYQAHSDVRGEE